MPVDYVSNENWIQTHQVIEIQSLAGMLTLSSDVPNGFIDLLGPKEVSIKSACSRIIVSSDIQETSAPPVNGSVEIVATGETPSVSLGAVSRLAEANGSFLNLTGASAGLMVGGPGVSAGLTLGPEGASLSSASKTLKSGLSITPQGVVIQVGGTSIIITADGIMMTCGDTSFNLTAASIVEAVTGASSRAITSSGHTLVGSGANQIISAETRFAVTPEGITTTAATVEEQVDATKENEAAGISAEFDSETSLTSAMTTIE
jgi:hypothetical protein